MEVDQTPQSEVILDALAAIICQLNIENSLDYSNSAAFFESFGKSIQNSFSALPRRPNPIATQLKLSQPEWEDIDKVAQKMTDDYKRRAEMSIRRLDVTIDSFFWSERVKQLESKVNDVYGPKREMLAKWKPIGASDVLAATEDLLVIEKASSYKQRILTKSDISSFTLKITPKDRGGRTAEIIAPLRESFSDQQPSSHFGNQGKRGHSRGGGNRHEHKNRPY